MFTFSDNKGHNHQVFRDKPESKLSLALLPKSFVASESDILSWEPATKIFEESDQFIVDVELPGIAPDMVDATVKDDCIAVQGAVSQSSDSMYKFDSEDGPFSVNIALPAQVVKNNVTQKHENGILTLYLPKKNQSVPVPIKINFEN